MNDLKWSLILGVISRVITFLNQVFSVPLVIGLIGIHEFTRLNIITAGVAWIITMGGSLLPSVVGDIARAKTDKDIDKLSTYISSSFALVSLFSFIVIVAFFCFFGGADNDIKLVFLLSISILVFSLSDNVRQGLNQNYYNALFNGLANLITIVVILWFSVKKIDANILYIIWAMLGSVILTKLINTWGVRKYFKINRIKVSYCRNLIVKAFGFILISIAYYINTSGIITLFSKFKFSYITEYIILQKILLIIMGVIVMIRNPLWSIIVQHLHIGNAGKVKQKYRFFIKIYAILTPFGIVIGSVLLPYIVKYWAGGVVIDSRTGFFFSVYLIIQGFSYINSIMYYGLEIFSKASKFLILEAFTNGVIAITVAIYGGALWQSFMFFSFSAIVINIALVRVINRHVSGDICD